MGITWILSANASRARVFEVQRHDAAPREIADFANPGARVHERDLRSDATGRFYGKGEHVQGHSTVEGNQNEHETERFAETLRNYLAHAHAEQRFGQLWVVAAPAFLGILRQHLPRELEDVLEFTLDKDYTAEEPRELFAHAQKAREAHLRKAAPPA